MNRFHYLEQLFEEDETKLSDDDGVGLELIMQYCPSEEMDSSEELAEWVRGQDFYDVEKGVWSIDLGDERWSGVDEKDVIDVFRSFNRELQGNGQSLSDEIRVSNSKDVATVTELGPEDNWEIRSIAGRVGYIQQSLEQITHLSFNCKTCNQQFRHKQEIWTTETTEPVECELCNDVFSGYDIDGSESYVEAQRLLLEDLPQNGTDDIVVYFHDDLVNSVSAGEQVTITGVVIPLRKNGDDDGVSERVMVALGVESQERTEGSLSEEEMEWCENELKSDAIDELVESLAPHIIGRDDIKRGTLLSLVTGANDAIDSGRTNSHIALIGDPSTGKSEIIKWIARNIWSTELASSDGASGVGLTGAVQQDERMGEWVLHPGVLSRVHKGIALVDELDKLSEEDLNRLYTALSDGKIEINKATIDATLPSETTLIAAANPKHGDFDLYSQNIAEQFDFPSPLIRRFDLIYAVKREDVDMDEKYVKSQTSRFGVSETPQEKAPYSAEEVSKLVKYARSLDVVMSEEAEEKVYELWKKARDGAKGDSLKWMDSRRMDALNRLTLASARLHGRELATVEDVTFAFEVMSEAFGTFLTDGEFDIDLETGKSETAQSIRKEILTILSGTGSGTSVDLPDIEEMVVDVVECDAAAVRGEVDQMDEVFVGDDGKVRVSS